MWVFHTHIHSPVGEAGLHKNSVTVLLLTYFLFERETEVATRIVSFFHRWSVTSAAMRKVMWMRMMSLREKVMRAAGSKGRVQSTPNWRRWLITVSLTT